MTDSVAERSPAAVRIAIGVEYNGAAYHGWQRQALPAVATIQAALEAAIAKVADHPVTLYCAGRTDAGVHATAQVAHFDAVLDRGEKAWVMGVNSYLPATIRVRWARSLDEGFHARFSATARRYQYWIDNCPVRPAVFSGLLTHCATELDADLMDRAAQCLLGERDFSSFRASACQSRSAMRNVHHLRVSRHGRRICIDIQANAFLLHMVRNIAGVLMEVGRGERSAEWVSELLLSRDRRLAAATAKPHGLYLCAVSYPDHFDLPAEASALFA